MDVVVWNMGHRVRSWSGLANLEADVALLSEARLPKSFGSSIQGGESTEGLDRYPRRWATAIVSKHGLQRIEDARSWRNGRPLKIPFAPSRPGSWEAAQLLQDGKPDVTVISLYGLLDEKSDASMHRSLSELTPIFEDPRYNRRVLLGGDFNIWTGRSVSSYPYLDRHQVVLERIRAFGLIDCLAAKRVPGALRGCPCRLGNACPHTRTKVDSRFPGVAYQDDYLFASIDLARGLKSCAALDPLDWGQYSDHVPIVAVLDD